MGQDAVRVMRDSMKARRARRLQLRVAALVLLTVAAWWWLA